MLSNIKEFADNSETLKEARINVKEMSVVKEIGIYIALIMLMFLLISIFQFIFIKISPTKYSMFFSVLGVIVVPVIIYLYVTKIEKRSWRSIGFSKGNAVSSTLKGLLIGFLMFFSVVIIGMLIGQFSFDGFDLSAIIYLIPCFSIFTIQCFGEEMYTRGWTMTYFSKRHSIFVAIIVNVIIFVVPHLSNPGIDLLSIANIIIFAVFFAVLFLRFDNIWVCGGVPTRHGILHKGFYSGLM